jgi:uncharacterized protein (TIGR03437 family)
MKPATWVKCLSVVCAMTTGELWAQQTATIETITSTLAAAVSNTANREFATCELRSAVWGGYNVRVFMPRSSTAANQALIFRITDGVLYQEVNSSPSGSTAATANKEGRVDIGSRDTAFARGVPFHVSDVSFPTPTTIRYTVHSNPGSNMPRVLGRYESVSSITNLQIVDTPNPFASSGQPQTRTFTLNTALSPTGEYYLSVVTSAGGLNCLMSNEVELLGASVTTPWIRSRLGALQSFNNARRMSSGTWIQIFGQRLAASSRSWTGADFQGAQAPVSLDGVRVNVNGRPAYVSFISPGQVNALTPDQEAEGDLSVEVINSAGTSNRITVPSARASPALLTTPAFLKDGRQHVAALFPDFVTFAGPANLISGVPFRPARRGETIIIFAVGCGATSPASAAGQIPATALPIAQSVSVRFGDVEARSQAFLAGQTVGLCQFNVEVPDVADGEHRLTASVGGQDTGQTLYVTVGQ